MQQREHAADCCYRLYIATHFILTTIIQQVLNASKDGRTSGAEKEAAGAEVASTEDWQKQKDNRKVK